MGLPRCGPRRVSAGRGARAQLRTGIVALPPSSPAQAEHCPTRQLSASECPGTCCTPATLTCASPASHLSLGTGCASPLCRAEHPSAAAARPPGQCCTAAPLGGAACRRRGRRDERRADTPPESMLRQRRKLLQCCETLFGPAPRALTSMSSRMQARGTLARKMLACLNLTAPAPPGQLAVGKQQRGQLLGVVRLQPAWPRPQLTLRRLWGSGGDSQADAWVAYARSQGRGKRKATPPAVVHNPLYYKGDTTGVARTSARKCYPRQPHALGSGCCNPPG